MNTLMIMAGGTGGHIYPGLAVAKALRQQGVNVIWMGVRDGLEDKVARQEGFPMEYVRVRGLWNSGIARWFSLPIWMSFAVVQCLVIILRRRPDALLGMGGYVCGPGGIAAFLLRRPLLIHESNAVPGLTNQILAPFASKVLTGFTDTKIKGRTICVGTPVRAEIIEASRRQKEWNENPDRGLNLLILGGSQGAKALNQTLPQALQSLPSELRPQVVHQTGRGRSEKVNALYQNANLKVEVQEFIENMSHYYAWADLAVARAGAMTVAELSVMGVATVFVPFPYAARNHQHLNAKKLQSVKAALICVENERFAESLSEQLQQLLSNRELLAQMAQRMHENAKQDATELVVQCCLEMM